MTFELPVEDDEAAISLIKSILTKIGEHPIQTAQTLTSYIETPPSAHRRARMTQKEQITDIPLKPDEDVIAYITRQDHFAHDLFSVQKNVYGAVFKSRDSGKKMYHKTIRQLRQVQNKIEAMYQGHFQCMEEPDTRIKKYVFEKTQTVQVVE